MMKQILKIEEVAQFAAGIIGLYYLPYSFQWWLWPIIFLAPDISMFGYLAGPRVGGFLYNLFHHKAVAIAIAAFGWFNEIPGLTFIGVLLFAHSSFDRIMGYGLKFPDSFRHTHLGWLPEPKPKRVKDQQ